MKLQVTIAALVASLVVLSLDSANAQSRGAGGVRCHGTGGYYGSWGYRCKPPRWYTNARQDPGVQKRPN
jgi:hypothetical protein